MHCRLYTGDMEDYNRRADADKTWLHLCFFIQMAYQHRLQTSATTAAQGGYTNRFTGLSAKDDVSNDNTAKTIALSAQTTASLEAKFLEPPKSLLPLPFKGTISSTSSNSSSRISNSTNDGEVVVAEVVAADTRTATGVDKDMAKWRPSNTLEGIR
jgi:hypothetical protein